MIRSEIGRILKIPAGFSESTLNLVKLGLQLLSVGFIRDSSSISGRNGTNHVSFGVSRPSPTTDDGRGVLVLHLLEHLVASLDLLELIVILYLHLTVSVESGTDGRLSDLIEKLWVGELLLMLIVEAVVACQSLLGGRHLGIHWFARN